MAEVHFKLVLKVKWCSYMKYMWIGWRLCYRYVTQVVYCSPEFETHTYVPRCMVSICTYITQNQTQQANNHILFDLVRKKIPSGICEH